MRLNEQCGACQSWRWCGRKTCKTYLAGKVPGHQPDMPREPLAAPEIADIAARALAAEEEFPSARLVGKIQSLTRAEEARIAEIKAVSAQALKQAPAKKKAAIVREVEKQVERVKAARAPSREGKKPVTIWLDQADGRALKMAAAKHGLAQEAIVAEGLTEMLKGKYKP